MNRSRRIHRGALRDRCQIGYGAPSNRDGDALAVRHTVEERPGLIAQLSRGNFGHATTVAQSLTEWESIRPGASFAPVTGTGCWIRPILSLRRVESPE